MTTSMQPCPSVDLPPQLLPHQAPARRADLLRMLIALTHPRQLPSLQLHGELAARAGPGSLL